MTALQRLGPSPTHMLRTLQPTEATVRYTVSTRSEAKSLATRLIFYFSIALRVFVGLAIAIILWTKRLVDTGKLDILTEWALNHLHVEPLLALIETLEWRYLAPVSLFVCYLALKRGYTGKRLSSQSEDPTMLKTPLEESLTVIRGLGLQISTRSSIYLRTPTTRFIPTTSVQDIFIHEAFKGFEVRFYLAIVVKGEEDVVVVFPRMLPRRAILETVWRGSRACLWEGVSANKTEKEGMHIEVSTPKD